MKKVLFSLVMICAAVGGAKAQDVLLATLQKGDGTQYFYGADAFKEAMEAAENGNIITLGAGTFNSTDITKVVSIYGNGYEMRSDTIAQKEGRMAYPTRLYGDFSIALDSINAQPATGLYMEGIYTTHRIWVTKHLASALFIKCRFQNFALWKSGTRNDMTTSKDVQFIHCRIASWLEPGDSQNMAVSNCIIDNLGVNREQSSILIQNNIIHHVSCAMFGAIFKNNLIKHTWSSDGYIFEGTNILDGYPIHSSCSAYNNAIYKEGFLREITTKDNNYLITDIETFWNEESQKDAEGYTDTNTYKLSADAQAKYIGTDGTQIGIYGNTSPFNATLTIPHIISKDIAPKTENGKLKVSIKVEVGDNSL